MHDQIEYKQWALKSSLKITVVGAISTEQTFIAQTVPPQHDLKFISFASVGGAIRSGAFPRQGLLMFVVSAEYRFALRQIRIMKWIRARQPDLDFIPLISRKSTWDAMREALAKSFPVYLPITFSDTADDGVDANFRYCTARHFSQIFEALADATFARNSAEKHVKKLGAYTHLKVADLPSLSRKNLTRIDRKIAGAPLVIAHA